MYFGVKIINFVVFGVKKSRIRVFLVSVENGAGVKKMTNFTYGTISDDEPGEGMYVPLLCSFSAPLEQFSSVP